MVEGNLDTTNLLLGIMAVVNVIEALLLIAVGYFAYRLYVQTMQTAREIEQRQVAPLVARLNTLMTSLEGILTDVRDVTSRVTHQTERVDSAIRSTIDRVDETADRVRHSVAGRINRVVGIANGLRAALAIFFSNGQTRRTSAHSPGVGTHVGT
jgi:methyl-accepting chemotaxis protein